MNVNNLFDELSRLAAAEGKLHRVPLHVETISHR